jgi:hypothetical protein
MAVLAVGIEVELSVVRQPTATRLDDPSEPEPEPEPEPERDRLPSLVVGLAAALADVIVKADGNELATDLWAVAAVIAVRRVDLGEPA